MKDEGKICIFVAAIKQHPILKTPGKHKPFLTLMLRLGLGLWMFFAVAAASLAQEVIAEWNFENAGKRAAIDPLNFVYTADLGVAANTNIAPLTFHGPSWYGWVQGYLVGSAPNCENWLNGAGIYHWKIRFSTVGYETITVSSAQRTSETQGPRDFLVQYSYDGNSWTNLTSVTVGSVTPNWTGLVTDVALPSGANNRSEVFIRWLQETNISVPGVIITGNGGTNRIDNIIIRGTEIQDPVAGTAGDSQTICSGDTPGDLILTGSDGDIQ